MTRSETPPSNPADRLADARKMIELKQEAVNELKAKLAEARRMTGLKQEAVNELKVKLADAKRMAGLKQETIEDFKLKIAEARELVKRKQESLDLLNSRLESFSGDQSINTFCHNTQEGMDKFFSEEIEESTYLDFGRVLKNILSRHGVDFQSRRVIDFGIGPGIVLAELIGDAEPSKLVGADFSAIALDHARERFPAADILQWDIYEEFEDHFEVVICTEVLEHLEYPDRALTNLLQSGRNGGTLVLTVPNGRLDRSHYHVNFWSPESWKLFLERGIAMDDGDWSLETGTFSPRDDDAPRINYAIATSAGDPS